MKKRRRKQSTYNAVKQLKHHPVYGHENWKKLKRFVNKFFGRVCLRCGSKRGMFHADHVVPYAMDKSRAFDPTNLQQLCAPCNQWKGGRYMEFRTKIPLPEDLIRYRVEHLVPGYSPPKDQKRISDVKAAVIRIRNGERCVL